MSVINTNITSMIGQQNLQSSQSNLTTSMERLSSGLRINSAKDDAAGQAIANRMQAQTTGLSQAQRNANDGISIAQTAEGALDQINDNVQRIRELTVQAQNGTNSKDDLQSIQDEINQRTAEIDRVSDETNFNGVKVLSSDTSVSIQVGANDNETISVGLEKTDSDQLGLGNLDVTKFAALKAEDLDSSGTSLEIVDSSDAALENATVIEGFKLDSDGEVELDGDGNTQAVNYIKTEDGKFFEASTATADGVVTAKAGDAVTDSDKLIEAGLSPLENIDNSLKTIDGFRSDLGAIQNRFESAIENLSTNETNLSAAQSRIEDADYAAEVADMTKNQILQQAGTSVLAQANQLPQNVLSLLG
ncbi:FliC/FljB family flagellin [Halomonas cibimaris]|uniref:Flagellin n=1 Tax=Halomonas cibimaris TaxID=657012 RepID=A0ABP7LNT8_9GAMM